MVFGRKKKSQPPVEEVDEEYVLGTDETTLASFQPHIRMETMGQKETIFVVTVAVFAALFNLIVSFMQQAYGIDEQTWVVDWNNVCPNSTETGHFVGTEPCIIGANEGVAIFTDINILFVADIYMEVKDLTGGDPLNYTFSISTFASGTVSTDSADGDTETWKPYVAYLDQENSWSQDLGGNKTDLALFCTGEPGTCQRWLAIPNWAIACKACDINPLELDNPYRYDTLFLGVNATNVSLDELTNTTRFETTVEVRQLADWNLYLVTILSLVLFAIFTIVIIVFVSVHHAHGRTVKDLLPEEKVLFIFVCIGWPACFPVSSVLVLADIPIGTELEAAWSLMLITLHLNMIIAMADTLSRGMNDKIDWSIKTHVASGLGIIAAFVWIFVSLEYDNLPNTQSLPSILLPFSSEGVDVLINGNFFVINLSAFPTSDSYALIVIICILYILPLILFLLFYSFKKVGAAIKKLRKMPYIPTRYRQLVGRFFYIFLWTTLIFALIQVIRGTLSTYGERLTPPFVASFYFVILSSLLLIMFLPPKDEFSVHGDISLSQLVNEHDSVPNNKFNIPRAQRAAFLSQASYRHLGTDDPNSFCAYECNIIDVKDFGFERLQIVYNEELDVRSWAARKGRETWIIFRGTASKRNAKTDLQYKQVLYRDYVAENHEKASLFTDPTKGYVHEGFFNAWMALKKDVMAMAEKLQAENPGQPLYVTGHSLGGALATLCAMSLALEMPNVPLVVYTFGSPRVGNIVFAQLYNRLVPNTFRVVNDGDVVTGIPGFKFLKSRYQHVGNKVIFDRAGNMLYKPTVVDNMFKVSRNVNVKAHMMPGYLTSMSAAFKWTGAKDVDQTKTIMDILSAGEIVDVSSQPGSQAESPKRTSEESEIYEEGAKKQSAVHIDMDRTTAVEQAAVEQLFGNAVAQTKARRRWQAATNKVNAVMGIGGKVKFDSFDENTLDEVEHQRQSMAASQMRASQRASMRRPSAMGSLFGSRELMPGDPEREGPPSRRASNMTQASHSKAVAHMSEIAEVDSATPEQSESAKSVSPADDKSPPV
eukprot:Clim_evm54s203 gene=Clim_evmTU54s203